ncbi:ATP-dependent DNA helicase [Methylomonas rapida]|uniref:DNA 5'-3' helicase n=1 Tax=Methylomonas rapida TaxID=2963939 RepID=A0ABY7GPZ2_9GAMM|nr:ATP-dependent DNA helicase [Methylomonas rapida]WAR46563.1 ATP-dependent DNA helicase [Methylomonas rapida]
MTELADVFGSDGALAGVIAGYSPRSAQIEMAEKIAEAIASGQNLIAEAGTGTGKTFAYLIPAILSRKKVIVSTGTKNLQDQLFNKDLPLIRKALSRIPFKASLLKGRANYLCTYRLELALNASFGYSKEDAAALAQIKSWSRRTKTGDVSEVADVHDGDPVWYHATSTTDNCLGQNCPDYADCFLTKARKQAQESDVVVVNHHLLCADWSIRETGFGELLPDAEIVIIDEAHQLADTASNFLGVTVSGKQLTDLADDALAEYFTDAKDMPDLRTACEDLQLEVKDMRLAFGLELRRGDWKDIEENPKIAGALESLQKQLARLTDQLERASVRSKGLESCFDRAEALDMQLETLINDKDGQWIKWYETYSKSFTLSRTPLDIAKEFRGFMARHKATWIFTSATLSVANNFGHFSRSLGLNGAQSQSWESPFDYPNQALFYHPRGLPQPSDPEFTDKIVDFVLPVLEASRGRAFFLFTSHKALQRAAQLLEGKIDHPLLVQGSKSKGVLLEEFKKLGNAILLATASFWEGVDVRGDALSCVIIDKLPFASPGDPVLKARMSAMEKQGRNPFFEHQLPSAIIMLRQGVGRLIRDVNDRGVLMVCDPRLLKRTYGQMFLDSVPAMKRSREIEDVRRFFATEETH